MLETLSPQEAMTLFRNGGAFFVDVRTEKEFLKRAIPGCPLVPLDKLEREGGLDSRFSGKPVVFFCRSGSRTQNKAELLERSASGKAYQQHDSHAKHHHESSYDKHLPPSQPFADVAADYS